MRRLFYYILKDDLQQCGCACCCQPVHEIGVGLSEMNAARCAASLPPVRLHSDAAQAIGKIRVNVDRLCVDFLTIVGHKVGGTTLEIEWCTVCFTAVKYVRSIQYGTTTVTSRLWGL